MQLARGGGGEAAHRTADGLPHCKTVEVERLDERVNVPVGAARGAGDRLLNRKILKYKCWPRCWSRCRCRLIMYVQYLGVWLQVFVLKVWKERLGVWKKSWACGNSSSLQIIQ